MCVCARVCVRRGVNIRSQFVKDDVCVNVSDAKENALLLCSLALPVAHKICVSVFSGIVSISLVHSHGGETTQLTFPAVVFTFFLLWYVDATEPLCSTIRIFNRKKKKNLSANEFFKGRCVVGIPQ